MSHHQRQRQRQTQGDRASKYPKRPVSRPNDPTNRLPPRQPSRTRRIDDDQAWDDRPPRSHGSSPRGGVSDDQGQGRLVPRSNANAPRSGGTRPGAGRAPAPGSRPPSRSNARPPSSGSSAGRGGQRYGGGVTAWDNPKSRRDWDEEPRGWDDESGGWDDGPRDWDDERWWADDRRDGGARAGRASTRNPRRAGAAYDDDDDWGAGNGAYGRARSRDGARMGGRGGWLETSRQWIAQQGERMLGTGKHGAQKTGLFGLPQRTATIVILATILVCTLGSTLTPFVLYQQMNALAHSGLQHVNNAKDDFKKVQSNPFDTNNIKAARDEFAAAYSDFSGVNARLNLVGLASLAPGVGSKVSAAQKLVPIAVDATHAGMLACDALYTLASRLKNPFGTGPGGLTSDDYASIAEKWSQIRPLANQIIDRLGQLTPSDLSLDPRLGPIVGQFLDQLPKISQLVDDFDGVVAALPMLLGVEKPATYMMLILDSSELRPTGGFIGNFGALAVNHGRMDPGFDIRDITLIDYNVKFGDAPNPQIIQIPDKYSWLKSIFEFPDGASWSLRDSNLDPDYPTTAKYAIDLYSQLLPKAQKTLNEQGANITLYDPQKSGPFAGVVTLSLGFFVQALTVTGGVTVDLQTNKGKIHEDVDARNFVSKIHFYALSDTGSTGGDNQTCGATSCSKVFTNAVVKAFLTKIKSDPATYIGKLGKVLLDCVRTKDIEFFINDPKAEQALIDLGIGATVQAPKTGDSVFEVESNIGANKDNGFLQYQMADQITIDQSGAASHNLTWKYTWPNDSRTFGESFPAGGPNGNMNYHSYARVYVPPQATLGKQTNLQGFGVDDSSADTFNRRVFHGAAYAYPQLGHSWSYGISWKTPGVVTHDDAGYHYHLLFQRQAGIVWPLTLTINLPACAKIIGDPQHQTSGLTELDKITVKGTTVTVTGDLTQDEQFQIDYTC